MTLRGAPWFILGPLWGRMVWSLDLVTLDCGLGLLMVYGELGDGLGRSSPCSWFNNRVTYCGSLGIALWVIRYGG